MRYVVDASVALAWYFGDDHDAYAKRLLETIEDSSLVVPSIWPSEMANALLAAERRNRVASSDVDDFAMAIATLRIQIAQDADVQTLGSWIGLGRKYGVTAYDAAYLAVALTLGLPLATLDRRLRAAAEAAGVARA